MKKLFFFFALILFPILTFAQALSGDKIIGSNQPAPYNTLTNAVAHINSVGVNGPVRFLLNDANYNAASGETFPIKINQFAGTSPANTLTIKPNVGQNVTITASQNGNSAISALRLDGADNIIIDGSNSAEGSTRNLTIGISDPSYDYYAKTIVWISSNNSEGAHNITIKNTQLKMQNRVSQAGQLFSGIFLGGNSIGNQPEALPVANGPTSNIFFINNEFTNVRQGIFIKGGTGSLKSQNITISANVFGSTNDDQKPSLPIFISNGDQFNVTDNNINGVLNPVSSDRNLSGIKIENGSNFLLKRNILRNIKTAGLYNGDAINISGSCLNAEISGNKISNLKNVIGGNIYGILLSVNSNSEGISIINNFISDISSTGTTTNTGHGIYINNGSGTKIYHNTVAMNAAQPGWSSAIYFAGGSSYDVRNNSFSNSSIPPGDYNEIQVIRAHSATAFAYLNNNNYFGYRVARIGNSNYTSLPNWQTATGKDQNSKNVNPIFVSSTDLHLQAVSGNAALDNAGAPLSAVLTDIDGQSRSTTTPDIGADEFSAVAAVPQITASATELSVFTSCTQTTSSIQSFTISGSNLTADILVTAPAGFEVSKDNTAFGTYVSFSQLSGSVATSLVYARMIATTTSVSGTIAITSTNAVSKNIAVTGSVAATAIWNGTSWSPNAPTSTMTAIINGNYSQAANIEACSLTVGETGVVNIPSGYHVALNGALTVVYGGSFTLQNNANLLQNGSANINSGSITVERNSAFLKRQDYTLWSSPTFGAQSLQGFGIGTMANRFYTYTTSTNQYLAVPNPSATNFETAKAYLIRIPNTHSIDGAFWNGKFVGKPNSGDITFAMVNGGESKRYNAIGNPYPSPINAAKFVDDNNATIKGTLYFWRKTNNSASPSYSTWTTGGFVTNGESQNVDPNGIIQTGQGFIVEVKDVVAPTVIFNNEMRSNTNANQIFKTTSVVDYNRIWLNATSAEGLFSQTLISYFTDGSDGLDSSDGKYLNDGAISFTSLIEDESYAIQGKSLPFNTADTVAMQFKATTAGNYTIAIDKVDGLFEGTQEIFLRDTQTGIDHNLKVSEYTFASEAGTFLDRFIVLYQNPLSVGNPTFDATSVVLYKKENNVVINSGNSILDKVEVYDIRGRVLAFAKNINANEISINVGTTNQVLIVKITSTDGNTITKKTIN